MNKAWLVTVVGDSHGSQEGKGTEGRAGAEAEARLGEEACSCVAVYAERW